MNKYQEALITVSRGLKSLAMEFGDKMYESDKEALKKRYAKPLNSAQKLKTYQIQLHITKKQRENKSGLEYPKCSLSFCDFYYKFAFLTSNATKSLITTSEGEYHNYAQLIITFY